MVKETWNTVNEKDVYRQKNNCPSGYSCRTRHPKGTVKLTPGSVKRAGADINTSSDQGRKAQRTQPDTAEEDEVWKSGSEMGMMR